MTTALKHLIKTCKLRISSDSKMASAAVIDRQVKMSKQSSALRLRTAKGARDFHPEQTAIRERILNQIIAIFKKHGAETIETPDFELKEVLTGKYGEQSKLVFNLIDQGGELLALRYDLTVPFARYLAMNKITNMKRYQIEKVYRRDEPSAVSGRYRELYQCDFDIAGAYDLMLPDAECLRIIYEIFETLRLGEYSIRVNHRRLLDGIFEFCGVRSSDFKSVCASIDKLDKENWETVRDELVNEKHLSEEAANKIGQFVTKNGPMFEMLEELEQNADLLNVKLFRDGLQEMKLLFDYVQVYGVDSKVLVFDLSLSRGLDYYTGPVFEVVLTEAEPQDCAAAKIGSVAGGGRYDNLVSSLDSSKKNTPCVGLSIGIEKIFAAIEAYQIGTARGTGTEVYVISAQTHQVEERMKLCRLLWDNNIKVEHSNKNSPELSSQLHYCEKKQIPFAIIIEPDAIERNVLKLRDISNRTDVEISRHDLIEQLQLRLTSKN